jgi:hypothetical protein
MSKAREAWQAELQQQEVERLERLADALSRPGIGKLSRVPTHNLVRLAYDLPVGRLRKDAYEQLRKARFIQGSPQNPVITRAGLNAVHDQNEWKFRHGGGTRLVITRHALNYALRQDPTLNLIDLLRRHRNGDWGDMYPAAKLENTAHIKKSEDRVVFSYFGFIKVVTSADRTVTTIATEREPLSSYGEPMRNGEETVAIKGTPPEREQDPLSGEP